MKKFLAVCGVSGVGKTTLIKNLILLDKNIVYVKPDTNRPLRENETDKNQLEQEVIQNNIDSGKYMLVNRFYNFIYCTPKNQIIEILNENKTPVLDYPISKYDVLAEFMGKDNIFVVYLFPPSLDVLQHRIGIDNRDEDGNRFAYAKLELSKFENGLFDEILDLKIVTADDSKEIAKRVLEKYYKSS